MINKPLCCIIDDEESSLASLKDIIEEIDLLEVEQSFLDPDKFLLKIDKLKSQIIFLDMEMPISGLDVANRLKDKLIIFVSGHTDKAYQTYDVAAIDFVPKPIRASRVKMAIEKALKSVSISSIYLSTEEASKEEIIVSEIKFISNYKLIEDKGKPGYYIKEENDKNYKFIYLKNDTIIKVSQRISNESLIDMLPNNFIKVNRQEIINVDEIHKKKDSDTILIDVLGVTQDIILGESAKKLFFKLKPNLL